MENFLDVQGSQMKIVQTGCKISNNDIIINLKIVETYSGIDWLMVWAWF